MEITKEINEDYTVKIEEGFITAIDKKEFIDSFCYLKNTNGDKTTIEKLGYEYRQLAENILIIEQLMREIGQSKGDIFSIEEHERCFGKREYTRKRIICSQSDIFNTMRQCFNCYDPIYHIRGFFPSHQLNPYIDVFFRKLEVFPYDDLKSFLENSEPRPNEDGWLPEAVEMLNGFVDGIRNEVNSKAFKEIIYEHQRKTKKNHDSLMKYIDRLFGRHSRLLVLRIDLGYGKKDERHDYSYYLKPQEDDDIDIEKKCQQAQQHRENLFNNMRSNKLFEHLCGFAWRLEYGVMKGFHFHTLFFFDGAKVQNDVLIARKIGEYWVDVITKGSGIYYNCNANKKDYQYLGIGMINHTETELIENLKEKVSSYLVKPDYYVKMALTDKKARTFGKGQIKPKNNRGRPRVKKAKRL